MRKRLLFLGLGALAIGACSGHDDPVSTPDIDGGLEAGAPPHDSGLPTREAGAPNDGGADVDAADAADVLDAADAHDAADAYDAADAHDAADVGADAEGGPDGATTQLPIVLDANISSTTALALDGANLYYTTGGGVKGVARAGGAPFVVAQPTQATAGGPLQIVNGTLYWDPDGTSLRAIDVSARGASSTLVGGFGTGTFGFFVEGGTAYAANTCNWIVALPTSSIGGAATTFVSLNCNATPQWIALVDDPASGMIDTLDRYHNVVDRISTSTKHVASFAVPANTGTLMLHGSKLYWVTYGGCNTDGGCTPSTLTAAALDGSSPSVIASGDWRTQRAYAGVAGIMTDAYAYLILDNAVERIDLATGENHVVYTASGTVASIAADTDYLFVADWAIGILRLSN